MAMYLSQERDLLTLGNDMIAGTLDLAGTNAHLATLTNRLTGQHFAFRDMGDCAARFSGAGERIDLVEWSFRLGSADVVSYEEDEGYRRGLHAPEVDVSDWLTVGALNEFPIGSVGYQTVIYPGYAWYRQTFALPEDARGQPISFVLGGCDDQDWLAYWVYLNGTAIGHAEPGTARWHPAPRYVLRPDDAAYRALRFGGRNALAIQTRGLDRRSPRMVHTDLERYSVGTSLSDQLVTVGEPYDDVSDVRLVSHTREELPGRVDVSLELTDGVGTTLEVRYWVTPDEPVLHKQVCVRNTGDRTRTLLEVDVHRLASTADVSDGGWGEICILGGEVFCGLRHPAGLAQGQRGEVSLRLLPGRVLHPGDRYEGKIAVLGVGPAGEGQQSFVRYLERQGRRRREVLSLYSPYGIYDFAGSEPTDVTERLLLDNLDHLQGLRARGIAFDYYDIDAGWSDPVGDLTDFDPHNFPSGPATVFARIRDVGMKPMLWMSPSYGPAAFRPAVAAQRLAPSRMLPSRVVGEDTEELSPMDSPELCLAADPYRTVFREALLHHVRHNGVRGFKMDGHRWECNNPNHGHLPGKYSSEPIMDALIDTLTRVRECNDEVMIIWYWGARSPWWLLHGETLYEHGIHMEAATPADAPSVLLRQSVTISLDQGADHAWDRIPLPSQDSLGVWISDTRWGSWMKSEGWQDAWVMDLARGSMLLQLWGDIMLFDEQDVDFLTRMSAWARDHGSLLARTTRILASPWSGEPYGYAHADGVRGMVAIHNPSFAEHSVTLRLGQEVAPLHGDATQRYVARYVHPHGQSPGGAHGQNLAMGDALTLTLAPFQVVMLHIDPATVGESVGFPVVSTHDERSRRVACPLTETVREALNWDADGALDPATRWLARRAITGRAQYVDTEHSFRQSLMHSDPRDRELELRRLAGILDLPVIAAPSTLIVVAQMSRAGVYWHHHALFDIIGLRATLAGRKVPITTTPVRWHEQAGGWSWITFQCSLATTSQPTRIALDVQLCLPVSVEAMWSAWLITGSGAASVASSLTDGAAGPCSSRGRTAGPG